MKRHFGADSPYLSGILLAATSLIWGTSFILIKKASLVFSPIEVGSLRIFFAFLVFIPLVARRLKQIPKKLWGWLLLSGFMGSLAPSLLFSWAGSQIQSSLSGMLNAITPLFTLLVGTVFFKQHFTVRQWTGIFLGLLGAVMLAALKGNGKPEFNLYILPVVLATIFYALNVNLLKIKFSGIPPLLLSGATILSVGIPAGVLLFGFSGFAQKVLHQPGAWEATGYVAILGLMGTALALILFNKLIQLSGPLTASTVTYIMPLVSVMWGIGDGEPIHSYQMAGLLAILTGVYLINIKATWWGKLKFYPIRRSRNP